MYNGWPFSGWGIASITIPSNIQKRLLRFLLKKAIGQFLTDELDLDNLDVQLGEGLLHLKELQLNVEVLNDLAAGLPIVVTDGRIGGITANIPWKSILSGECVLEIHNLQLTLEQAKPRNVKPPSEDSHILSKSIHFAGGFLHEILPEEDEELRNSFYQSFHSSTTYVQESQQDINGGSLDHSETFSPQQQQSTSLGGGDGGIEGVEILARLIDKIMSNVKVVFRDTLIRMHHKSSISPLDEATLTESEKSKYYYFDLEIPTISYSDETPRPGDESVSSGEILGSSSVTLPPAQSEFVRSLTISGFNLWIREQESQPDTEQFSGDFAMGDYDCSPNEKPLEGVDFSEIPDIPDAQDSGDEFYDAQQPGNFGEDSENNDTDQNPNRKSLYEAMIFTCGESDNFGKLTIRQNALPTLQSDFNNPSASYMNTQEAIHKANSTQSLEFDCTIKSMIAVLSPGQVILLADLITALGESKSGLEGKTSNNVESDDDFVQESSRIQNPPESSSSRRSSRVLGTGSHGISSNSLTTSSAPILDTTFNFSMIEIFILYQEPSRDCIPAQNFFETRSPETLNIDHLKIEVQGLNYRFRRWESGGSVNPRRSLGGTSGNSYGHLRGTDLDDLSRLTMEISIVDLIISEWIGDLDSVDAMRTKEAPSKEETSNIPFIKTYNHILSFDSKLLGYDHEENFPSFSTPVNIHRGSGSSGSSKRRRPHTNKSNKNSGKVIRVEICDQDRGGCNVTVALDLVQLRFDFHIIDRLSKYIELFSHFDGVRSSRNEGATKSAYKEHSASQLIIDDLHTQRVQENSSLQRTRVLIDCDLIRLLLICPDLGGTNENTIDYRIHPDLLIADIIKIHVITGGVLEDDSFSPQTYGLHEVDGVSVDQQQKIKIEFSSANIFLKRAKEQEAKCFLTLNLPSYQRLHQISTTFPNVEITYRPASAVVNRISFAGNGFPSSPFSFTSFEGEKLVNNEEEEILIFKQRTIENSLFEFNFCFPFTHIRITKSTYDVLQILLNDLSLWQPKFATLSNNDGSLSSSVTSTFRIPPPIGHDSNQQQNASYGKDSDDDDFEMRRRIEGERSDIQEGGMKPSWASLVVSMENVEIVMVCDNDDCLLSESRSYLLNMSEFRFFTVVKHQGNNDTYICLDNDDLTFWDISDPQNKLQILCRTIDKTIKTKNMRPMISVVMSMSLDVESKVKETNLALSVNGVTLRYSMNQRWIEDLIYFLQGPNIPYADLPSQFTKLIVVVNDSSIHHQPDNMPSCIVVALDTMKISSIIPESPMFKNAKLIVQNADLLVVDDIKTLNERITNRQGNGSMDVKKYWKTVGFAHAASLDFAEISLKMNMGEDYPHFMLEVTNEKLTIETCADSFHTLLQLLGHITSKDNNPKRKATVIQTPWNGDDNVLAGLDENAFVSRPITDPKKISRVTPISSLDFVDEYYSNDERPRNNEPSNDSFENNSDFDDDDLDDEGYMVEQQESGQALGTIPTSTEEGKVHKLDLGPIEFVENYFAVPTHSESEEAQENLQKSITRIRLRDFNLVWKIHDGYDWEKTRTVLENNHDGSPQTASEVDYSVDEYSDILSQSSSRIEPENLHTKDNGNPSEQRQRVRPKLNRSKSSKLDVKLEKINLEFDLFPNEEQLAFRLLLLIRDVEILDNIKTSAWRKFLSHMRPDNDTSPRETRSNMVRIELNSVRPILTNPREEFRLKAKFLPLRFHIDQDALNFIIRFFSFQDSSVGQMTQTEDDTFFQLCEIQPIIMRIDYKPKHIDYANLKEGNLVELMNFFHFDAADMTLRDVKLRGIKGWRRLFEELGANWLPHIKSTQVPNVVSGVAPIRSLVNIGSGVADLVLLPIEQYKKDGRIIRGLQKGTQSFAKATTMEAIKLGTKLAVGTQILLEHADEILSFETEGQASSSDSTHNANMSSSTGMEGEADNEDDNIKEFISKYADQPADLNEGIEAAYKSLRQNFGTAAHTIFAVPMEVYEKSGTQGSVKAVIRAVPVAVLKPMIGASEAVSKTLLGLRNTIDPNKKLQMEDKYKYKKR